MIEKELGRTGERVPAIGLGTWQLGGEQAVEALVEGVKAGAWLIDTAEAYGTEGLVGQALKKLKDQGLNVFLATKVSPSHFHHDDVIRSCEASLSRLGVKTIDLYQLHWPNHSIPIAETMGAMEELVKAGKIRYIGVSNFSSKELDEARASLKREDVVSDQVKYSPFDRHVEPDLFPYCEKEGITVIAYSPLEHGRALSSPLLGGKVAEIAAKYGKSPVQVLLNWVISKPRVIAIPKASSVGHALEDAGAGNFSLAPADLEALDAALGGR